MSEDGPSAGADQPAEEHPPTDEPVSSDDVPNQAAETDALSQYPQVEEMASEAVDAVGPGLLESLEGAEFGDADVDDAVRSGCGPSGCAFAVVILVLVGGLFSVLFGFDIFESDESSQDAPQEAAQPDESGFSPPLAENEYDADGNLVPIPGVWHVYNEAGVDTCTYDISVDAGVQRMELEVLDGGERILIREIFEDETVGPAFILERVSSSDTEVTYREDLSEEIGRDQAIEATFSSSSTWGGRVEGCPDRGAQGSLIEPSE